jgi:hypothetical protein
MFVTLQLVVGRDRARALLRPSYARLLEASKQPKGAGDAEDDVSSSSGSEGDYTSSESSLSETGMQRRHREKVGLKRG